MRRISILFFLTFGLLQFSFGTLYYVSTTGNDTSGDGSSTKPWRTLKFAVSKVPGGQGHTIKLSTGTFVENGPIDVPTRVNIEGSGRSTVLKAVSSFYYYPATPSHAVTKFLIRFISPSPTNGGQSIKNLTINGDGKKLHGGILFQNRDNIRAEGLRLEYINFTGLWVWKSKNSRITNCDFFNCAWGSTNYCSGALMVGDLDQVEIDHVTVNEGTGYGFKALDFNYGERRGRIANTKIHDCRFSVVPTGLWANGKGPNIAFELWGTVMDYVEIYNNYFDNNISLVCEWTDHTQLNQSVRVHDNLFDMVSRANGNTYSIELCLDYAQIDHNYFYSGSWSIVNWHESTSRKDWDIHHNVFYGLVRDPALAIRTEAPVTNLKFNNNTFEATGTKPSRAVGLVGGISKNVVVKNNLLINSGSNSCNLIHLEGGATIQNVQISNNLLHNSDLGNIAGSYLNITGVAPEINASGNRPDPYYRLKSVSQLIDKGVNVGYSFLGSAPDIGAYESTSSAPPPPPSGSNILVVRARGNSGTETIQLQVNNSTIATWKLTTTMTSYTATTSATGGINVVLADGAGTRDAQIDYIQVNGTTRQAEAQVTNTGVYQNGKCGGTKSEWLNCTGYISFGNVSSTTTTTTTTTVAGTSNTILVRARGSSGNENLQVQVNNITIATWRLTTSMTNYTTTTSSTGAINIRLVDGTASLDAQVDYIQVNGSTRQAESQSTNTGVYQNGRCGGSNSEWMHCTGYIAFGNISSATASARLRTSSEESEETDEQTTIDRALFRFANPVKDGVLRMEFDEEVSEVYILDLAGRTMKVFMTRQVRVMNEELAVLPGLYLIQPVRNGKKSKPHRLVVD